MQSEYLRIDKWLWHARFYRTRALAQAAAASGVLRLNNTRVEKASISVKSGDVLTLARGREVIVVRVESLGTRRGPASEARSLYHLISADVLDPAATAA